MNNPILARYAFLPWMKQGLSVKITEKDTLGLAASTFDERTGIDLTAKIIASGNEVDQVSKTVEFLGPGDVVGIDKGMIVKSEPANWITNFEPYHLPFIEFYDEDFPWRFTPAKANDNHQLRPWLMLVVLKESEFARRESQDRPLPYLDIPGSNLIYNAQNSQNGPLPLPEQVWAWAHVQFNGDLDPTNTPVPQMDDVLGNAITRFRQIVKEDPDRAFSRIICPRKLENNTGYHAFLVPTFETGRLAGLGVDAAVIAQVDAQQSSWGVNGQVSNPDQFPIYHEFYFKTGAAGDFEYLVRQLMPKELSQNVGRRLMDIQRPGYNIDYDVNAGVGPGVVQLEGALKAPNVLGQNFLSNNANDPFVKELTELLNLSEGLIDANFNIGPGFANNPFGYPDAGPIEDDPIVTPPIYGRWHALARTLTINGTNWVHELNLDPRWRAVAGMGARFVQENQDFLMDQAWDQLGEVLEANKKIRWAQLAQQTHHELFRKHVASQPGEYVTSMEAKAMRRIKDGTTSMYGKVTQSALPNAALSHAFRKIRRSNGPVMKRVDPTKAIVTQNENDLVRKMADQTVKAAPEKVYSPETANVLMNKLSTSVGTILNTTASAPYYTIQKKEVVGSPSPTDGNEEANLKTALQPYATYFNGANWQNRTVRPNYDLAAAKTRIIDKVKPLTAMPPQVYWEMENWPEDPSNLPPDRIVPALAYPQFKLPVYESVVKLGVEYLIPNLNLIPYNSVSLLKSNQKFIEAFLAGMNHEFGRELLWREFPTDQRGSYFRQFWDSSDYVNVNNLDEEALENRNLDIKEMHEWPSNLSLGQNGLRPEAEPMVLAIRGDLLKKFPNTVIYAQKAKWARHGDGEPDLEGTRQLADENDPANIKYPVFGAKIDPDITFIGFDLDEQEAKGDRNDPNSPGWFIVLKERPGETRFGFDIGTGNSAPTTWADIEWGNTTTTSSGHIDLTGSLSVSDTDENTRSWSATTQSADIAYILYQSPFMVAIHADEMIPEIPHFFPGGQ